MGQQQLLLLILVTILIGIASIIAIDTMDESHVSANRDAVRQDILLILGDAEKYYYKAAEFGGGGRSFDGITIDDVSMDSTNHNGTYIVSGNGNTVTVEGTGVSPGVSLKAKGTISGSRISVSWE